MSKDYTQADYLRDFKTITDLMYQTTERKNSDYTGDVTDPFKNFRMIEDMGVCSVEAGIVTRLTDKLMRMSGFVKNGVLQVQDEKIEDTAIDLAVYSIIFALYIKNKKEDWLNADMKREDYTQPLTSTSYSGV